MSPKSPNALCLSMSCCTAADVSVVTNDSVFVPTADAVPKEDVDGQPWLLRRRRWTLQPEGLCHLGRARNLPCLPCTSRAPDEASHIPSPCPIARTTWTKELLPCLPLQLLAAAAGSTLSASFPRRVFSAARTARRRHRRAGSPYKTGSGQVYSISRVPSRLARSPYAAFLEPAESPPSDQQTYSSKRAEPKRPRARRSPDNKPPPPSQPWRPS